MTEMKPAGGPREEAEDQGESQPQKTSKGNLRYQVENQLAQISSGELWSAVDVRRGGAVTLFYPLLKEGVSLSEAVEALGQAVRQNAPLRETGYHAYRDVAVDEQNALFLVLDRPEGYPLSLMLREQKSLDLNVSLSIMIQVCGLLSRAHEEAIFSATLNPDNLIISKRPNGALSVSLVDLALDRRPLSQWVSPPPKELTSPPHSALTQEKDRRHFSVYLSTALMHQLIFGVAPSEPVMSTENKIWPALPTYGKELDERLEACLHTVLLKGLALRPSDRFPRIGALQRALIGLRQLTAVSSPAFELLASTQSRLGRKSGSLNLTAPKPGVERALRARQQIHKILDGQEVGVTLEELLEREGGVLLR